MIKFVATDFLDQIAPDVFWSTGSAGAYIACTIESDDSPVLMLRVNQPVDGICRSFVRPYELVSDETIQHVVGEALPRISMLLQKRGARGISFHSSSPETIQLMAKHGFVSIGGDDHQLNFSSKGSS